MWDLYCGVGGFALHCAGPGRTVTGIETSEAAIASASQTAHDAGLDVRFAADDATTFALGAGHEPDLVVVNPPRRGIGAELSAWLESLGGPARRLLELQRGVARARPRRHAVPASRAARVLDMFPQTTHYEVIVLLERVGAVSEA